MYNLLLIFLALIFTLSHLTEAKCTGTDLAVSLVSLENEYVCNHLKFLKNSKITRKLNESQIECYSSNPIEWKFTWTNFNHTPLAWPAPVPVPVPIEICTVRKEFNCDNWSVYFYSILNLPQNIENEHLFYIHCHPHGHNFVPLLECLTNFKFTPQKCSPFLSSIQNLEINEAFLVQTNGTKWTLETGHSQKWPIETPTCDFVWEDEELKKRVKESKFYPCENIIQCDLLVERSFGGDKCWGKLGNACGVRVSLNATQSGILVLKHPLKTMTVIHHFVITNTQTQRIMDVKSNELDCPELLQINLMGSQTLDPDMGGTFRCLGSNYLFIQSFQWSTIPHFDFNIYDIQISETQDNLVSDFEVTPSHLTYLNEPLVILCEATLQNSLMTIKTNITVDNMADVSDSSVFNCKNKETVTLSNVCDGGNDCGDGSDELNCTHCSSSSILCSNIHKCIPRHHLCDCDNNCGDWSDEQDCADIPRNKFRCGTGHCIPKKLVCNSLNDCPDNSDENIDTCALRQLFYCHDNNQTIQSTHQCDGWPHCQDGSDELNCTLMWIHSRTINWIHPNSVKVGWESYENVFVVRGNIEGVQVVGKLVDAADLIPTAYFIDSKGRVVVLDEFQVLVDPQNVTKWVYSSHGEYIPEAVVGGNTFLGEEFYIGRAGFSIDVVSGSIIKSEGVLHVPYKGNRRTVSQYQILLVVPGYDCINGSLRVVSNVTDENFQDAQPSNSSHGLSAPFFCTGLSFEFDDQEVDCDHGENKPIKLRQVCDGDKNCPNGSDELNCTHCHGSAFLCKMEQICIKLNHVCDGHVHCPDSEWDESEESCGKFELFKCTNNQTIQSTFRCNGSPQCHDKSDEVNCTLMWIKSHTKNVFNFNRVKIATDDGHDVSVARTKINGDVIIGKFVYLKDFPTAYFALGTNTTTNMNPWTKLKDFEILIDPQMTLSWVHTSDGRYVPHSFIGGRTKKGENVFIGRFFFNQKGSLGSFVQGHKIIFVPFGKQIVNTSSYEILIVKPNFKCSNGQLIPADKRCDCQKDCPDFSDELNCRHTPGSTFKCTEGQFMAKPRALVKIGNSTKILSLKKTRFLSCLNFQPPNGTENVKILDTFKTCIRLYSGPNCTQKSTAYYPIKENFTETPMESIYGSISPCFDNEFDQSHFEWNGEMITKLEKLPLSLKLNSPQRKIFFVPDILDYPLVVRNESSKFQFELDERGRLIYITSTFEQKDIQYIIKTTSGRGDCDTLDKKSGDLKGHYLNPHFVPKNFSLLNEFRQDSWNKKKLCQIENNMLKFLEENPCDCESIILHVYAHYDQINENEGMTNSPSNRPSGISYFIDRKDKFSRFYIINLPDDQENYDSQTKGSGNISSAVETALIIILVLALISCVLVCVFWKRIKNKLRDVTLRSLTEQEVHEFLQGKQNGTFDSNQTHESISAQPFDMKYQIQRQHINLGSKRLGSGQYGLVTKASLVKETEIGVEVAVKSLKPNADMSYFKALLSEIKIMAYIGDHEHIVQFLGACTENIGNGEILIVVELCSGGSLLEFLKERRKEFQNKQTSSRQVEIGLQKKDLNLEGTELTKMGVDYTNIPGEDGQISKTLFQLYNFAKDIADGMAFLTTKNVIHGDLAVRNVLITGETVAKISDFGLSRHLVEYTNYIKKQKTPLPWKHMAYESLKFMEFSIKSDVWAYGVTLFEIFSLAQIPYAEFNWNADFMEKLKSGYRLGQPEFANQQIYHIMLECWNIESTQRPEFSNIFARILNIVNNLKENDIIHSSDESYVFCD